MAVELILSDTSTPFSVPGNLGIAAPLEYLLQKTPPSFEKLVDSAFKVPGRVDYEPGCTTSQFWDNQTYVWLARFTYQSGSLRTNILIPSLKKRDSGLFLDRSIEIYTNTVPNQEVLRELIAQFVEKIEQAKIIK